MASPKFWLVAGPNGAGKTTLVQSGPLNEMVQDTIYINPGDVCLELLRKKGIASFSKATPEVLRETFFEAANWAFAEVKQCVGSCKSVCVETVLSTPKYCELVEHVLTMRGRFYLAYVALNSPALAQERVRHRVSHQGHDVPIQKIAERWEKSIEWLPWFAERATRFWVFDNSDSGEMNEPMLLAEGGGGRCRYLLEDIPRIADALRPLLEERQ